MLAQPPSTHMGDGRRVSVLRRIEETEIPASQFLPTHIGRNPRLRRAGHAKAGGLVDFTTSTVPLRGGRGQVHGSRMLTPVDAANITSRRTASSLDSTDGRLRP
jgi:beta-aspartyl-dipeptidase (metallo-type)